MSQQRAGTQRDPQAGLFGTTRRQDPAWLEQLHVARKTSYWRQYYREGCLTACHTNAGRYLYLTPSFTVHSPQECQDAYIAITEHQRASDEDTKAMVYAVSYDHDRNGRMSRETWARIVSMLKQMFETGVRVQLWVDKVDAANRTGSWGLDQLLPYVMFPVIRVGSRDDPGFWSNMEGLAGVFGRGLYHDHSLSPAVIQNSSPVVGKDFFGSRATTFNAGDAVATFYVHLMFGTLAKYRNHHQEALRRLALGASIIARLANPNLWLDLILGYERNSRFDRGRFEILNAFECRTDIPKWNGLKEWVTIDRYVHNVFDPSLSVAPFRINGFVRIYEGDERTMAVVHWQFRSSGWTRRLSVKLAHGSREQGRAITHFRFPGYRDGDQDIINREEGFFAKDGLRLVYTFDSLNIRWE